jgi:hypothetical protein
MSTTTEPETIERWPITLVMERWYAFTPDEREALLRYGSKPAPWESTPDTAYRILKADRRVTLEGARCIDAIFRTAYNEFAEVPATS